MDSLDDVDFWGSSPHTRGARALTVQIGVDLRIIPAYAGSTRGTATAQGPPSDHPRIRGEHYVNSVYPALAAWIIPAYAGSTLQVLAAVAAGADHPRIRGEHY